MLETLGRADKQDPLGMLLRSRGRLRKNPAGDDGKENTNVWYFHRSDLKFIAAVTPNRSRQFQKDPVMQVDEQYRLAKLHNDTGALGRLLAENFYETNQNGNSRNKTQSIELFPDGGKRYGDR